ncbi:Hypothetical predicted protein [Podarcis lilfordi]|uniref:Uncharacterized protein n=1 Tax=Podarcis lilfordi TaxID=74358 RepID=A0AA35PBL7_9SAUR|nr:Hypothetical predicted protein [Podarcis lilfordi]
MGKKDKWLDEGERDRRGRGDEREELPPPSIRGKKSSSPQLSSAMLLPQLCLNGLLRMEESLPRTYLERSSIADSVLHPSAGQSDADIISSSLIY